MQLVIVISIPKYARWSEGDDWDWKKPFLQLKNHSICDEDKWNIALKISKEDAAAVYGMCDGRHRVKTMIDSATSTT